jgi:hypothetical protein
MTSHAEDSMSKHATNKISPAEIGPSGAPAEPHEPLAPERDPLSPFGHAMLSLFRGPLADVRFPDLDRTTLETSANDVLRAQRALEAAERALEEARARVRDASASFVQCSSRALAYARIFATGQPELEELLAGSPLLASASALGTAREAMEPKLEEREKKRRGRPRKDAATSQLLPMGASDASDPSSPIDDTGEVEIAAA